MKLVRPHIPIRVRLEVIARQLGTSGQLREVMIAETCLIKNSTRLIYMLDRMFGVGAVVHLDHDPPLCLREIIDPEKGLYSPDANDPRYLIYRTKEDHRIKTFVRGDGAQLSDAGKRRKEIKRQRRTDFLKREERKATFNGYSRWPPKGSRPLRGRLR